MTSCLYSCTNIPFWKDVHHKRKKKAPKGSEFLPFRVESIQEGGKNWPGGYKTFSSSTQLSMKFVLFINLKILTKFWNYFHAQLNWASLAELSMKNVLIFWYFYFDNQVKIHAQ